MSPENTNQVDTEASQETLDEFPINVGDMLWVTRNVKDENGNLMLDEDGEVVKRLEDNWEVMDTSYLNPANNVREVLLRNANPTIKSESKIISPQTLRKIQQQVEDEIIASAARNVTQIDVEAIEKELEGTSSAIEAEAVEAGAERLTPEEAKKMGEPPVELAGIEDPDLEQKKSIAESVSIDFRLEAAQDVATAASDLDKMRNSFKIRERNFFDAMAGAASRLEIVLSRAGDYPAGALQEKVQLELKIALQALTGSLNSGLRIGYEVMSDIDKVVARTRAKLDEHTEIADVKDEAFIAEVGVQAVEGTTLNRPLIDEARKTLTEIDEIGVYLKDAESATSDIITPPNLRAHMNQLSYMLNNSYSAAIDLGELRRVVEKIKDLSNNDEARETYKRAQVSVNTLCEQLKTAAANLDPRTQAEQ